MGAGASARAVRVTRVVGVVIATVLFAAFLIVINYPYALDWIP